MSRGEALTLAGLVVFALLWLRLRLSVGAARRVDLAQRLRAQVVQGECAEVVRLDEFKRRRAQQ